MRILVILSSKYVTSDLVADYGSIVPTELPLANRPLLYHQIDTINFAVDEVVLTLPYDYSHRWSNNNNILFCDPNYDVREVIGFVMNAYKKAHEFVFYFGDSLLEIDYTPNTLYTGMPHFSYPSWYYTDEKEVFAGAFAINVDLLKKCYSNTSNTTGFLTKISCKLTNSKAKDWFDFGNYLSYYNSKKRFLETRSFNSVSVSNELMLTKESSDIGKMFYEYNWLLNYSNKLPANCPTPKNFRLTKSSATYEIEYFALPTLAELLVFGRRDIEFWNKVISECLSTVGKLKTCEVSRLNNENFYQKKTQERILSFDYKDVGLSNEFCLEQSAIAEVLDNFDNELTGGHGDLCFSNILYNPRTGSLKMIDPRGYLDRSIGQDLLVPSSYDLLKIAHSVVAGYDHVIVFGETTDRYEILLDYYLSLSSLPRNILYAGLSHLFFTMIPLHNDREDRQSSFVKLAKKYYANYTTCR